MVKVSGLYSISDSFQVLRVFPPQSMRYGELQEWKTFLARRATESKAVVEGRRGAVAERTRLVSET